MTLIEQLLALVIFGILLMLAMHGYSIWIKNVRIRAIAESIHNNLQLARSEAIKRNTPVRFSLMTAIDSASCAPISANRDVKSWYWILSTNDPTGSCISASKNGIGEATGTIQAGSPAEGNGQSDIRVQTTQASIRFNGLARVSSEATYTVSYGGTDTCGTDATSVRCLEIQVAYPGGQIHMCDPAVTSASDPRKCE